MSLDKNKTIAEVGRRTRLRNHDVQKMLEALIDVWSEELTSGGRIELGNARESGRNLLELDSAPKVHHLHDVRAKGRMPVDQLNQRRAAQRQQLAVFASPNGRVPRGVVE